MKGWFVVDKYDLRDKIKEFLKSQPDVEIDGDVLGADLVIYSGGNIIVLNLEDA